MRLNNKEISERLKIINTTWRRWSREFLPPDPSAGMRAGKSRLYTAEEAFAVYLGGTLVGGYKLSVHDARSVLQHLLPWLKRKGYFPVDGWQQRRKK